MKSAGYIFNSESKFSFPPKSSFADKLNAAIVRLELGLGGHSISDTLLFGAKVLSIPSCLSPKNVTDIENNNVEGSTT